MPHGALKHKKTAVVHIEPKQWGACVDCELNIGFQPTMGTKVREVSCALHGCRKVVNTCDDRKPVVH